MTRWLLLQANPNISSNAYARLTGRLSDHRDRTEIVPGRTSLPRRVIAPPGRIRSGGGGDRRRAIWPAPQARAGKRLATSLQQPARWRSVCAVVFTCDGALGNLV